MSRPILTGTILTAAIGFLAAPALGGPSTPPNCSFAKGVTTCTTVVEVVSGPVKIGLCLWVTPTTITTTVAHRGAPSSNGPAIGAPVVTSVDGDPIALECEAPPAPGH